MATVAISKNTEIALFLWGRVRIKWNFTAFPDLSNFLKLCIFGGRIGTKIPFNLVNLYTKIEVSK